MSRKQQENYRKRQPGTKKKFLTFNDLAPLGIPFSRTHLWRLMRDKKFPDRLSLGGTRSVVWEADAVMAWLAKTQKAPALKSPPEA